MQFMASAGPSRTSQLLGKSTWPLFAIFLGLMILGPVVNLEIVAFQDGAAGIREFFDLSNLQSILITTTLLGIGSTIIALLIGITLAVLAFQLPRRWQWMSVLPIVPLVIPPVSAIIGWMFLLSPHTGTINVLLRKLPLLNNLDQGPINIFSPLWIIIITGLSLSSFVYLFVSKNLQEMGTQYEMVAASCGASRRQILFKVTLPLLRPSIVNAGVIVMLLGLGQFNAPLLLGRTDGINVLSTSMYQVTRDYPINYGLGAALGLPLLLVGIFSVLFQRYSIRNQHRFEVARSRTERLADKKRPMSVILIALYTLFVIVLPILSLLYVSFSPFWTGELSFSNFTMDHWSRALDDQKLRSAIQTSLLASAAAAVLALPLGLMTAWALSGNSRAPKKLLPWLDVISTAPVAIPASLLGFGFLFTYSKPPLVLYGSAMMLIVVYLTIVIPHIVRMQLASMVAIGKQTYDAGRVNGAGFMQTFFKVMIPQLRRGIAATLALVFVMLTHEFSASLMVRSVNTRVMGTALYEAYEFGLYPAVAVTSLVMIIVTMAGVLVATMIGGRDSLRS